MAQNPLARYLIQQKWKILLTTQGLVTCMILYHRFQQEKNANSPSIGANLAPLGRPQTRPREQ